MRMVAKALSIIDSIKFDQLTHVERRCSYCQRPFEPGEDIIVLFKTKYGNDDIFLLEDSVFILHIKNPLDKEESCEQEFVAKTIISPIAEGEGKSQEIVKKDGETESSA